jgi:hypothetical protein
MKKVEGWGEIFVCGFHGDDGFLWQLSESGFRRLRVGIPWAGIWRSKEYGNGLC